MSATTVEKPASPVRFVDYIDERLRAELPPMLTRSWVADEQLTPLAAHLETVGGQERVRLDARARVLADNAQLLLREEMLPADLFAATFVDPMDRLQIVGSTGEAKVRIDEDLVVAIVRKRPVKLEGARAASLRGELRAAVAIPLGGADRKPIAARKTTEHDSIDPNGIYTEFDPPPGSGFVRGQYEALCLYSNGKVLVLAFRPFQFTEQEAPEGEL